MQFVVALALGLAVGGGLYSRVGIANPTLLLEGTVSEGGLEGRFTRSVELGTGKFVETRDYGAIRTGSINVGRRAWSVDVSGFAHELNSPFARRLARSEAWLAANQGCRRPQEAQVLRVEGPFEVTRWVPRGGAPIELWYDTATGLLNRAILEYSENRLVRHYDDWRDVGSHIEVAFRQVDEDIEDESTIAFVVEKASMQSQHAPGLFRPSAPPDDVRFLEPQRVSTVAYEDDHRTRIYIPIYLNGHGPFAFELDSGGHFILTSKTASTLGLVPQGAVSSTGAGSEILKAGYVHIESVKIGTAELVNQTAKVLAWSDRSNDRGTHPPRAGILGLELFERFRVSIDREARTVALTPSGQSGSPGPGPWAPIPMTFDEDAPLIAGSFDGAHGQLMVDTGNAGPTIVEQYWAEQQGMGRLFDTAAVLGRDTRAALGVVALGPFSLTHEVVSYYGPQIRGSEHTRSVAAVVGEPLLSRFDLLFDYGSGVLWLKPLAGSAPSPFNRSGLWLSKSPDGTFQVASVSAASPAAEAGVKSGEIVDELAGESARSLSTADAMALFRQPAGTNIVLRMRQTSVAPGRSVTVRLRDAL
jgi:hypothetical protein